MIQVVNRHTYQGPPGIYIGRGSLMGNPYGMQAGPGVHYVVKTRREAIEGFEDYLDELEENSPVMQELKRLLAIYKETGELILVCSCAPNDCHGHIISKKLLEMAEQ